MSVSIPAQVPVFTVLLDGPSGDDILAIHQNNPNDEITALATLVGMFGSGKTQAYGTDIIGFLANNDPVITKTGSANLSVSAGTVWICNSSQSVRLPRQNSSATTVAIGNLDTGSMAVGFYYIYLCADSVSNTFTVVFSASPTAPTGYTNYELYGWFYNETVGVMDVTNGFFGHVKRHKRELPNAVARTGTVANAISDTTYGTQLTECVIQHYSTGRPVLVQALLQNANTANYIDNALTAILDVDGSQESGSEAFSIGGVFSGDQGQVKLSYLFTPGAGAHTYTIKAKVRASNDMIDRKHMMVMEF